MEKLKTNISRNNLIYLCLTVGILGFLAYGLTTTFNTIFHHLGSAVDKDMFEQSKFYVISFVLVIQFLFLITLGRVKSKARTFCLTFIFNVIAICLAFQIYEIAIYFYHCFTWGINYIMFIDFFKGLASIIFWPKGCIWYEPHIFNTLVFAALCMLIIIPLQYRFLKKDTKNKKMLLWAISISSFICYSAISFFFYFKY